MVLKRFVDVLLSFFALLFLSPVLAGIALAVWLDSGSPVLFHQLRVGMNFRPFRIHKFRTMRVQATGPMLTVAGDRRITSIVRFLRLAKLDELPQLWNVLRGEMSLVGPRPEVPEFVALFESRFRSVLIVRPGITDPASIQFRNEESVLFGSENPQREYAERILPIKLELAEHYVRTQSTSNDLVILLRTAMAIVRGDEQ